MFHSLRYKKGIDDDSKGVQGVLVFHTYDHGRNTRSVLNSNRFDVGAVSWQLVIHK